MLCAVSYIRCDQYKIGYRCPFNTGFLIFTNVQYHYVDKRKFEMRYNFSNIQRI